MEKQKFQYEGLKWLVELELLNHPQVINQLKFNILMVSKHIKEVELLIYRENKSILVLLELSWIGRKFKKTQILQDVHEVVSQMLPSFRFRITEDPKIMELAIEKVKTALTGGKDEDVLKSGTSDGSESNKSGAIPSHNRGNENSIQASSEESSKVE